MNGDSSASKRLLIGQEVKEKPVEGGRPSFQQHLADLKIVRMRTDFTQVQAKLDAAIEALATHPGDIRARLLAAFGALQTLDRGDFPEPAREAFAWIMEKLHTPKPPTLARQYYENRYSPVAGLVRYALSSMSPERGEEIAKQLYRLHVVCTRVGAAGTPSSACYSDNGKRKRP